MNLIICSATLALKNKNEKNLKFPAKADIYIQLAFVRQMTFLAGLYYIYSKSDWPSEITP